MDWLILSIAGAASLAATAVIDKFLLGRLVNDPMAYLAALVIMQQTMILAIPFYLGWGYVYPQTIYALAAGVIQVALWAAYLKALSHEEASRVEALVYVFPVLVFLGAFFLMGESLEVRDYGGGILLVCSTVLISYRPGAQSGSALSPALKYMALFWIFAAAYALSAKYLLGFMSGWHLIYWSSLGGLPAILPLLWQKSVRGEAASYFRSGAFLLLVLVAEEVFDLLGRGAFVFAYSQGSVALVSSVSAMQPFITLIYVILLSRFFPGILWEEMDSKTTTMKAAAVILIIAGVYLVS